MKILLTFFILFCSRSYAFERNEVMGIKTLEKLDGRVYLFKRGIEDGLKIGHHIRLKDDQGFVTRGVVLALDMRRFMAFVYHNYRPKALNMQTELSMRKLARKFIPPWVKGKVADLYLEPYFEKILYLTHQKKAGKKKRVDKYLNKSWDESRFTQGTYHASDNPFDFSQYNFESMSFVAYASPFKINSFNKSKNFDVGVELDVMRQKKLRTKASYKYENLSLSDPFTGEEASHQAHELELIYDWSYLNSRWRLYSFSSFENASVTSRSYLQKRFQLAPVSFDYFIRSRNFKDVHLGFRPMFEHQTLELDDSGLSESERKGNDLRFGFIFHSEKKLSSDLSWDIDLSYSPKFYVSEQKFDLEDNLFTVGSSLKYLLAKSFSFSYAYEYNRDVIRFEEFGLPADRHLHSFYFHYEHPF